MKKKIRIVGSKIHDIGYRYFLMENALAFGIERFRAINIKDEKQIVEVYVEGEDKSVNEFCRLVSSNFPPDALVDEVKIEDYTGYVPRLEAFALVFNIGQARKFIEYGKQVLKKQDKMLEKQDETIKAVKEVGEKVDKVAEKIDNLRLDLKAYLDERLKKLEMEIEKIKEAIGLK